MMWSFGLGKMESAAHLAQQRTEEAALAVLSNNTEALHVALRGLLRQFYSGAIVASVLLDELEQNERHCGSSRALDFGRPRLVGDQVAQRGVSQKS